MPKGDGQTATVDVYRREGEYDCCMRCMEGSRAGHCKESCIQPMRGCCSGVLTLRQGTMGFAVFELISQTLRLLSTYAPWSYRHIANFIGAGLGTILIITCVLGLLGAHSRNISFIKIFLWSNVFGVILLAVLYILFVIRDFNSIWWVLFYPVEVVKLWWMYCVGTSYIDVLQAGGTGDENKSENVHMHSMEGDASTLAAKGGKRRRSQVKSGKGAEP